MSTRLIGSIALAALLTACAGKPIQPESHPPIGNKPAQPGTQPSSDVTPPAPQPEVKPDIGKIEPNDVKVNPLTDPNNILSKRSIYFDYDRDEVKAEFLPLVEAHAQYLASNPKASLILQGNADDRGSREYNLGIGQRRAVAVKRALNVLGTPDKQIETVTFGEEKPLCTNQNEDCRAQNRRVDIVYDGE